MGLKVDAVPGRLNQYISLIRNVGTFYGQCSELCGVGHGFMPIVVKAASYDQFIKYLNIEILPVETVAESFEACPVKFSIKPKCTSCELEKLRKLYDMYRESQLESFKKWHENFLKGDVQLLNRYPKMRVRDFLKMKEKFNFLDYKDDDAN